QGIEDRLATLETELRTPEERREWLAARSERHPVIVAEHDGRIAGWGSLNVFNARPAYGHVADFSVYVERAWRGKGVGRVLLERLSSRGAGSAFTSWGCRPSPSTPAAAPCTGGPGSAPSAASR